MPSVCLVLFMWLKYCQVVKYCTFDFGVVLWAVLVFCPRREGVARESVFFVGRCPEE